MSSAASAWVNYEGPSVPPKISVAFAWPTRWTFRMSPIRDLFARHVVGRRCIVDPMCGDSQWGHHVNDLARGGVDAEEFVRGLIDRGVRADCVIFDPPYSPRQISECYKAMGRKATAKDTQNAHLYKRVRDALSDVLEPGGIALSFGWQSAGFGHIWPTRELLIVQHGGAHNDTICVVQEKPGVRTTPTGLPAPDSENQQ